MLDLAGEVRKSGFASFAIDKTSEVSGTVSVAILDAGPMR